MYFHCPENPLCSTCSCLPSSLNSWQPLIFSCFYSFAFSRMSHRRIPQYEAFSVLLLSVTCYQSLFTIQGSFLKGQVPVELGIAGRAEKAGPCETRKQTSQTSPFRRGPASSGALKNGFYTCAAPQETHIPTCTKRLSNKAQVRNKSHWSLLIAASQCTLPGRALAYFVCPEEAGTDPDQGRKQPTQTFPGSVMNVNLNPQRAYSIF